ncbi:MAG: ectoine/hydroxyectoine ABC transporter substrate-binding protein EhuB [Alphaproteobacteria bacterium]|nr:ectoine/hydroxyectoine ABC transporter substrate-binding protein EhuB [Alphaproteobacteria bacterium]
MNDTTAYRSNAAPAIAMPARALALAALGCAALAGAAAADDLLASLGKAGAARIAIAALPPYAFLAPSGQPEGYTIDISRRVMQALGVGKLVPTVTTWDAMIPGLQARQFDFVPAGLNISAPRCQVVLFTAPITAQQDALYMKPGNAKGLTGYASVARAPGVRLAVLAGSSQEAFALKQGIAKTQLVAVPDTQAGIAAVTGGRADAFAVGQYSVPDPAQKGVELVVDRESPLLGVGIAFRNDSREARDAFDRQLDVLRANGTMKELYQKHGFTNWDVLARLSKASDVAPGCD